MEYSNNYCIFVSDLTTLLNNSSTNCSMEKDSSNKNKKTTQLTKEYEEHMLLLEGGDKSKHTTFDC